MQQLQLHLPLGRLWHRLRMEARSNLRNKSLFLCSICLCLHKLSSRPARQQDKLGIWTQNWHRCIPCINCVFTACELGQTPWSYTTDILLMLLTPANLKIHNHHHYYHIHINRPKDIPGISLSSCYTLYIPGINLDKQGYPTGAGFQMRQNNNSWMIMTWMTMANP